MSDFKQHNHGIFDDCTDLCPAPDSSCVIAGKWCITHQTYSHRGKTGYKCLCGPCLKGEHDKCMGDPRQNHYAEDLRGGLEAGIRDIIHQDISGNDDLERAIAKQLLAYIRQKFISKQALQKNVGHLRVWLNEDRITDPKKMISEHEIEVMLELDNFREN